jgi:hypothetical protein
VVQVQEQTHELEGRVTGLERDMQHTLQLVEKTSRTVESGFAETRRMFQEAAERDTRQASDIHGRIDEQQKDTAEKGQVSWPLVISAIVAALAIGGVFVAFVNMSLNPIRANVAHIMDRVDANHTDERTTIAKVSAMEMQFAGQERRLVANERWQQWWFENMPEKIFTTQVKVEDAHFEIEKLHKFSDTSVASCADMAIRLAETHGRVAANMTQIQNELLDVRLQLRTARPDPFYGREGTAMEERIRELETFVRDAIAKEKNGHGL